ncbi:MULTISPECIES: SRPBCC family protein [unclassified Bacillus (in: firmicutes)]|uniref:SRPBCC family protein n=1 Tax=unclassified Bacillus (in: firmicutes) TaxID=185979 RepID=UPI0008ED4F71|nr:MULTISPECIES: SRPBCC family protein [unclassified Bacillus (in: firmicutes)]SFA87065.1 Polyketide cyclase / dehydrase and lipid transport [Bacillus sp. UNCCL13]SFQ84051.1 Polyketide cyclase / dehydrase and lipid transport [Bacillus sp. cl95]
MVDVLTEIIIDCPKSKVSDYAANPDTAPEWYVNIKSSEWKTPKPLTVGSKIAFKAEYLGKELAYIYEIVDYLPGVRLTMQTAQGPFPMETTYTWESVDVNRTKMTLRNKGIPSGFSIFFSPVMSLMMKKTNQKDLKKIKAILESEK